ncbi:hypothetical protein VW35_08395 [Devosia soli]|uniref:HTH lacI-type domain-containing protein n=1 Tax=Devosia soli TaxID=361041 RepID=A0A0F5LDN9_9HYPH|nr:LacI family DNA-binding transcriptional regulator [Devosia soli]KKB80390.1 hypothetical protein VW35_08395 [Devosia soli]
MVSKARPPNQRVSINDVAAVAGVSRGAVTRALNNKADISQDTKRKVLEAAERLGYRPSRFARNFASRRKSKAIGFVVKSFRNPFFTDLAADLLEQSRVSGWQVVISSAEGISEAEAVRALSGQVDVVAGHFNRPAIELQEATDGMPLIYLEGSSDVPGVHAISLDMRSGMKNAIEALYERGAKRIGMIDSDYTVHLDGTYKPSPRCQFFKQFVDPDTSEATVHGAESMAGGEMAIMALLEAHPDLDAVIVFNDLMAIGALLGAFKAGFAVPGRIRIMGVDGLEMGRALSPALSSLHIDRAELSRAIIQIANQLDDGAFREVSPINQTVVPKLIMRHST